MYFIKRIFGMIPVLLILSIVCFVLFQHTPGNPFDKERVPASPEIEHKLKEKYHLDEPGWKQYLRQLGLYFQRGENGHLKLAQTGWLEGDFGPSLEYRDHTVNDIIAQALPTSIVLGLSAFLFSIGVGIPLGFLTAVKRGQWSEYVGTFFTMLTFCIPNIVVGPVLILIFSIYWHIFPVALWGTPMHIVLPTIVLGLYFAGRVARLMQEGMLNTLHSEFITTARAKGVSESAILWRHAFRLAVLPVLSYSGPLLADMLTGSFVVENIFQIPGIGTFMVTSLFNKDGPMTLGLVLLYGVLLLVLNLIVDFSYSLLDRRVRYE
jgi:oligopeptide transport system permease protein